MKYAAIPLLLLTTACSGQGEDEANSAELAELERNFTYSSAPMPDKVISCTVPLPENKDVILIQEFIGIDGALHAWDSASNEILTDCDPVRANCHNRVEVGKILIISPKQEFGAEIITQSVDLDSLEFRQIELEDGAEKLVDVGGECKSLPYPEL